nr:PHP domain-containing protein [Candidatus Sigynarchaeota archaeon]
MAAGKIQDYHVHSFYSDGESTIPSIIRACANAGCVELAITDHVDQDGAFTFIPEFRRGNALPDYIEAIHALKDEACIQFNVNVHVGIELSTTTNEFKAPIAKNIVPLADGIEIILIEGLDVNGATSLALATRGILEAAGCKNKPIFIAHPVFAEVLEEIELLIDNDIGLELNESKFSPVHRQNLDKILDHVVEAGLKRFRFTMGSDAHSASDAGKVPIVHKYAVERGIIESLYWL